MLNPLCDSRGNNGDVLDNRIADINYDLWRFNDTKNVIHGFKVDPNKVTTHDSRQDALDENPTIFEILSKSRD